MFFNFRGTCWTLAALGAVALLCLFDLKCAARRDARAREQNAAPPAGALARVKEEVDAGKAAWTQLREEQLNEQLRTFRLMAKRFAETGQHKRARATIALIQEIEREKAHRAARR